MVVSASGYSDVPDPLELTLFVFTTGGPFNVDRVLEPAGRRLAGIRPVRRLIRRGVPR